jgi:hypothetical protein
MNNVEIPPPEVNPARLKPVFNFLQDKTDSGEIPAGVASNAATALRQFAGLLRADEPDDPAYALDNLDELARRYLNKHPKNHTATTKTYVVRCRFALEHYIAYTKDPLNYRFPPTKERTKRERADKASSESKRLEEASLPIASSPNGYKRYPIPLGQGRQDLLVMIPEGEEIAINDVFRVMWALFVHCKDFDPRNPQVMAMVRHAGDN